MRDILLVMGGWGWDIFAGKDGGGNGVDNVVSLKSHFIDLSIFVFHTTLNS
jgi:hypothetical protein